MTVNGELCDARDVALLVPHAKLRVLVPAAAMRGVGAGGALEVAVSVRGVAGANIVANLT